MIRKAIIILMTAVLLFTLCACGEKDSRSVQLKKNEKKISLELDETVKTCSRALYLYTDKDGKEYITFQNDFKNEIYFYDSNRLLRETTEQEVFQDIIFKI